jgi:hypothetical protein
VRHLRGRRAVTDPLRALPPNLLEEALRIVASTLSDVVPSEAQVHLLNAQRELLLAVAVIIDHNRSRATGSTRRATGARRTRKPSRVPLD